MSIPTRARMFFSSATSVRGGVKSSNLARHVSKAVDNGSWGEWVSEPNSESSGRRPSGPPPGRIDYNQRASSQPKYGNRNNSYQDGDSNRGSYGSGGRGRGRDGSSASSRGGSSFRGHNRQDRQPTERPTSKWNRPTKLDNPDSSNPRFIDNDGVYQESWEKQETLQGEVREARELLMGSDLLYGLSPLLAAFRANRRKMYTLFMQKTMDIEKRKDASAIFRLKEAAVTAGIEIVPISKHALNDLADQRPHQGFVLDCEELSWQSMSRMPTAASVMAESGPAPVWLVMDQVFDPQNLGAMIRSAAFLGASGILGAEKNCAPLTPVASKASAGCLETLQLHTADNLPRLLEQAREDGWKVYGADNTYDAVDCNQVQVDAPTILVMGNEGFGLRTNIKRACTGLIKIQGGETLSDCMLDSLNVSVATGIILHGLVSSSKELAAVPSTSTSAPILEGTVGTL